MNPEHIKAVEAKSFHQGINAGLLFAAIASLQGPRVAFVAFGMSVVAYLYRDGKDW